MGNFKAYRKSDVDPSYLEIRGKWFKINRITDPQTIELVGDLIVECLGYGAYYFPQSYFTFEEWERLNQHSFPDELQG
jgi:hypothetical protein